MAENLSYNNILSGGIGEPGHVISSDVVLESVVLDESINGDGGLTVGWNSLSGAGIAAGTTYNGYILMSPYLPSHNGDGSYRYDVKFSDPIALLGKKLFYQNVRLADDTTMPLYTFSVTAQAETLFKALSDAAGSGYTVVAESVDTTTAVTVSFDGDTIKSAATKIADALGVSVWYTPGTIHIGTAGKYHSGEYYDSFVVLGGTKNMTKKITTSEGEEYAAVTKRLTLDPASYPGSKMGSGMMEKILIFDNIYPKARFKITSTYERKCYLLDEDGNKIPTSRDPETGQATAYAMYSKWYISLKDADAAAGESGIDLSDIESSIIDGTTLRMQFVPTAEGGNSRLAGREFELVHFTTSDVTEKGDDDVNAAGYTPNAGEFRIVMGAEGGTVLPSTTEQGIIPRVGDLVTLVNIKVPDVCYTRARQLLLEAGQAAARTYDGQPSSYTDEGGSDNIGETRGDYICTNVHTDLITGERTVTWGTLAQKGLLTSLIDKVDGVQTAGGGGTTGSDSGQHVAIMSKDQWDALANAGGHLGMVTVHNRIDDLGSSLQNFGSDLNAVEQQADKRMDIYFCTYAPHPQSATDTAAATLPNSAWKTDSEKAQHVEDILYNYNREASDPDGGRAWRWMSHADGYYWDEITDADTIAALEKANDVSHRLDNIADDQVISASEKKELRKQWDAWVEEYENLLQSAASVHVDATDYMKAFCGLGNFLDAPSDDPDTALIDTPSTFVPRMINSEGDTELTENQTATYKAVLLAFRTARTELLAALGTTTKMSVFVSETSPEPPFYVGDRWLWKNHDGMGQQVSGTDTMMYCVQTLLEYPVGTEAYTVSDYWKPYVDVFADARPLLAALADKLYTLYSSDASNFPITVSLSANGHGVSPHNGQSIENSDVSSLLASLYDMIGTQTFKVCIVIPASVTKYDLLCTPVTCVIPGTEETVTGGITIRWYNGSAWEYIQQSTSSLLENLGTKILAMVFGSNNDATEAAGLNVGQRFAKMFASAQVYDPDTQNYVSLAQALFGLSVGVYYRRIYSNTLITEEEYNAKSASEKEDYYRVGYKSSGKMSADMIDFSASNSFQTAVGNAAKGLKLLMQQDGENSTFTLGYYVNNTFTPVFSFDSNGKLILAADKATIDAATLTITNNGSTAAVFENGKIKAQFIDVANLNVAEALTGKTINMENAVFENLHVTGEVTGKVMANDLYRSIAIFKGTANVYICDSEASDKLCIYITSSSTDEHVEGNYEVCREKDYEGLEGATGVWCTGSADIVVAVDGEGVDLPSGQIIRLPRCQNYGGKLIEVRNQTLGGNSVTVKQADDGNNFKLYAGSTTTHNNAVVNPGVTYLFYSDGNYWIRL